MKCARSGNCGISCECRHGCRTRTSTRHHLRFRIITRMGASRKLIRHGINPGTRMRCASCVPRDAIAIYAGSESRLAASRLSVSRGISSVRRAACSHRRIEIGSKLQTDLSLLPRILFFLPDVESKNQVRNDCGEHNSLITCTA